MSAEIERFIPVPDVRERHAITVKAPAGLVYETARTFDLRSIPIVRAIFALRAKVMGARADAEAPGAGIIAIRLLLLPAVRREAEKRWRATGGP